MFLLDDILFAPIKGLTTLCRKVHEAAQEDLQAQETALMADLADLHQLLDTAQISEEEFDSRESAILDRLEACQQAGGEDDCETQGQGEDEDDGE